MDREQCVWQSACAPLKLLSSIHWSHIEILPTLDPTLLENLFWIWTPCVAVRKCLLLIDCGTDSITAHSRTRSRWCFSKCGPPLLWPAGENPESYQMRVAVSWPCSISQSENPLVALNDYINSIIDHILTRMHIMFQLSASHGSIDNQTYGPGLWYWCPWFLLCFSSLEVC